MNEQARSELDQLKRRLSQLEQEVAVVARQLVSLKSSLQAAEQSCAASLTTPAQVAGPARSEAGKPTAPPERAIPASKPELGAERAAEAVSKTPPPAVAPVASAPLERVPPMAKSAAAPRLRRVRVELAGSKSFLKGSCARCGGHIEFPENARGQTVACPHCGEVTELVSEAESIPVPPPIPVATVGKAGRSFELRLGKFWLVRIGIVVLLTGLVFFGTYAYQNFIGKIGPAGKVSLLYLASALLLGAGAWWQRKAVKESLKNYAQVLFAGGLAAVYFTTYAAHHIGTLRVIGSALLDGALLLGWAGFMVWVADRKKSEVLALFAVGLAYYTAVMTRVGTFTLYSNLVLTVAAVFFLVRNRWAALSFASLLATYAAYGYWRFFYGNQLHWATPGEGLGLGAGFLAAYWIVFTVAVFLSKHEAFAGGGRATFLTLNNCGFFLMFLLTMLQVEQSGFWKFALIYGAVLLGLAELSRRVMEGDSAAKNGYLIQGWLLVTIGWIAKFAGLKLALILGAESVVLLGLGYVRGSVLMEVSASISGAMAVGWGIDSLHRNDWRGLCVEGALGAMMAFNAFWSHRRSGAKSVIRPAPAFFTVLALIAWLAATWYNTSTAGFPLTLAVEALVLTLSIYALGVPEIALFGQGYLLLAHCAWLAHFAQPGFTPPWWNPVVMIAVTLALSHWWQRQKILGPGTQLHLICQALYAMAIVGVLGFWLERLVGAPSWLALTSLLAVGVTAYGVATRAWFLAGAGQVFLVLSAGQFVVQLWAGKPEWYLPLAPLAALGLLSYSTVKWFQRRPDAGESVRSPLLQLALGYRWAVLVMALWWVWRYVPARDCIWVWGLLGVAVFLWAGWRRNAEGLLFGGVFTVAAFGLFWMPLQGGSTVYVPNLFVILALLGQQRMARRYPDRYGIEPRIQAAMIVLGGLSLWLLVYRWLHQNASGFYLTASWSALALILLAGGMVMRERWYRWVGLGVLAAALGRVFLFDVWKLETLYRILSFVALGIVLLVLGFLYNRFEEKIKEWL